MRPVIDHQYTQAPPKRNHSQINQRQDDKTDEKDESHGEFAYLVASAR